MAYVYVHKVRVIEDKSSQASTHLSIPTAKMHSTQHRLHDGRAVVFDFYDAADNSSNRKSKEVEAFE
jgi:hypothetical protein